MPSNNNKESEPIIVLNKRGTKERHIFGIIKKGKGIKQIGSVI